MKQLQFYKYAIWFLVLLNLSIIAFFFFTGKPPHHRGGFNGKKTIELLNLDREQHLQFTASAKTHQEEMVKLDEQQQQLLKPYFESIVDPTKVTNQDAILRQVEMLERKKIERTYQHLNEVKLMLRPDQQVNFKQFMNQILKRILRQTKKNQHPPKGFKE